MEDHLILKGLNPWRLGLAADLAPLEDLRGSGGEEGGSIPLPVLDDRVWRILSALLALRWLEEHAPAAPLKGQVQEELKRCCGGIGAARIRTLERELARLSFRGLDPSFLGAAYERFLASALHLQRDGALTLCSTRKGRRGGGAYYTPPAVVNHILARTLACRVQQQDLEQLEGIAVLDPACGSGSFLAPAAALLEGRYRALLSDAEYGQKAAGICRTILEQNLYGVDLDVRAVEVTRRVLQLQAAATESDPSVFPMQIRWGNALIGHTLEGTENLMPFRWEDEFPGVLARGGFDVVVGNPPWVSFGLRGAERCEGAVDTYLRSAYPNSAEYKLSVYALFMERAIRLLRDGGICGFIVPDSFLLGRYFSRLRRHILDTVRIREIELILEDFWREGSIGRSVIVILEKEPDAAARDENKITVSCCSSPADLVKKGKRGFRYRQGDYRCLPHTRFRLYFSSRKRDLIRRIECGSIPLAEIVSIHTGIRSRIGQKSIVSTEKRGATWRPGLISGSEIGRYRLQYGERFLNIDPALLWSGGWDPAVVSREKLLVRQTGDSIHATFDKNGYYHLNNCHSIVLKDENYLLKYLLAILNSTLMNCYYQLVSLERGRALAQIDMDMLGEIPIRPAPLSVQQGVACMVDRVLGANACINDGSRTSGDAADAEREVREVLGQLDRKICRLYNLTDAQIRSVEGEFSLL